MPIANIITASMGTMRKPRFSKTEGNKYATAENSIIQSMKNLVAKSLREFNIFLLPSGSPDWRGSDWGELYRFGSTPIAIFENPWVFARSMVLTTGPCMASESALIIIRVSLSGIFWNSRFKELAEGISMSLK